jgi:hypothetical protein
MIIKCLTLAGPLLLLASTALAEQRTDIHHTDGSTSTVVTNDRGDTLVVTPGHGGGQFGSSRTHEDVVKQYIRPDDQIERR